MHSLRTLRILGSVAAPFIVNMPFDKLYPTGKEQDVIIPKHSKYYYLADVLAGDFLYIRRYLPEKLNGQVIITNTTTREDMQMLKNGASASYYHHPGHGRALFWHQGY